MNTSDELTPICYSRNFLTEVIVRVDLVSPIEKLQSQLPKRISSRALKHFPIPEPQKKIQAQVHLAAGEVSTKHIEITEWNFYGQNRGKHLRFGPDAFWVKYSRYESYEKLRDEFREVTEAFFSEFDDAQPSRLGMRYINQIEIAGDNPLDWQEQIEDSLLGMFGYIVEDGKPTRIFNTYETAFDEFNLRFQFGVFNPDYPAPIRQRQFTLDYDAYFQGALEPSEIEENLDLFHSEIQKLFEKNITAKTREALNEKP